jgi:murein DD-endopeptidase MepM/ murein hydrolase activator NlpD
MKRKLALGLLSLLVLSILAIIPYLVDRYSSTPEETSEQIFIPVEQHVEYGIICDSLRIERGVVRKNQSLSEILSFYDIGSEIIHQIANLSRPVFDVRKMKVGNPYTVLLSKDTVPEVLYFIYEEDKTSYITYKLKDDLSVEKGEKNLTRELKYTAGTITSSLWNSLVENGNDPALAIEMSEVYAWTIDFFGIQRNDHFKVVFEELNVEDEAIGIGNVEAACFNHMGKDLFAYRFTHNGTTGYYDENGQNLQRAFLKAPLRFRRISSKFSNGRMHPILKIRRPHHGVDYAADYGTPVQTIGDGTVIEKGWNKGGGGNYIKIKHNSAYTTVYMHLAGFAKGLQTGSRVSQGEVIGYVGSTGLSTGPHLDFRVYFNGKAIDPLSMESPPSEPVAKEYLEQFFQVRDSLKVMLDSPMLDDRQPLVARSE